MDKLTPFYADVQSHYDLSDEFFALFLDPTRTYSCAYFERDEMSLEEAQIAKVDLALGKCDLRPSMTLLDVGCGWGSTMLRAIDRYQVNVIGLTLSRNQFEHVNEEFSRLPLGDLTAEVRLEGWEDFDEPVDRIVSIGAFEHFRRERYDIFFQRCRKMLPEDGRMLLHTITQINRHRIRELGLPINREVLLFGQFIQHEIFPGVNCRNRSGWWQVRRRPDFGWSGYSRCSSITRGRSIRGPPPWPSTARRRSSPPRSRPMTPT